MGVAKKTCRQGCMRVCVCSSVLRNPVLKKKNKYRDVSIVRYITVTQVLAYVPLKVFQSNTVHVSPKYQPWKENSSDNVISLYMNIYLAKNFYP